MRYGMKKRGGKRMSVGKKGAGHKTVLSSPYQNALADVHKRGRGKR